MDALSDAIMEVTIHFTQRDIAQWFGHQTLEVMYVLDATATYGDVMRKLIQRYQNVRDCEVHKAEAEFYDHFLVTSKGRIVRRILDEPIDEKEVTVWYFFDV